MADFNAFDFLKARAKGLPVTETEKTDFAPYIVVQAVSMDPKMRKVAHEFNEISFHHLPRDIQAMAFQGLNRVRMDTRWCNARTSAMKEKKEQVDHAMAVTGLSHNDVKYAMKYGLLDMDDIEERYLRIYDPGKLIELYTKKATNRKVHAAKVNGGGK